MLDLVHGIRELHDPRLGSHRYVRRRGLYFHIARWLHTQLVRWIGGIHLAREEGDS